MAAIQPVRRPLDGLNPYDAESVRQYALHRMTDDLVRRARVTPRLLLVHDDHVAEIALDTAQGGDPLATFLAQTSTTSVEHRVLTWCIPSGEKQRVAIVFAASNDEDRSFWLARRTFTLLPGGMGSGETSWELAEGKAFAALPDLANALARPGGAWTVLPAAPPPPPKISGRVQPVPPGATVPTDPIAAVNAAADMNERVAWQKQVDGVLILLFRSTALHSFHVVGEIPVGLDDLVRAMCAQGETPSAVATMKLDLFTLGGRTTRAVKTVGEAGGERIERIVALMYEPGDAPGSPTNLEFFASKPTPVGSDGWIGVAPVTELDLFPLPQR